MQLNFPDVSRQIEYNFCRVGLFSGNFRQLEFPRIVHGLKEFYA